MGGLNTNLNVGSNSFVISNESGIDEIARGIGKLNLDESNKEGDGV